MAMPLVSTGCERILHRSCGLCGWRRWARPPGVPVVLALDLGTSNLKAQRFDDGLDAVGDPVHRAAAIGPNGRADIEDVARAAEALLDEALQNGGEVDAVAVSSAWHTLVGVDDGRATT